MSNRPSFPQIVGLVEFLEQHPAIARGLLRTMEGKIETKKKWDSLAITLNSLGGVHKDGRGWAKYWAEKKCALKKMCAERSASMHADDESAGYVNTLSDIEQRLISLMGQEFGHGKADFDPLLQMSQNFVVPTITIPPVEEQMHSPEERKPTVEIPDTSNRETTPLKTPPIRSQERIRKFSTLRTPESLMARLVKIEERKANSEEKTAQALNKMADSLDNIGNAMLQMAKAQESLARAIAEAAGKMQGKRFITEYGDSEDTSCDEEK